MARATNSPASRKRRKKVLKYAKGYFGNKSKLFRYAKEAVQHAWQYAYATRRAISLRSARRVLQKAEIMHPAEPIIQFNLACYAAQLAKLPEAASRLTAAIALHPDCQSLALLDPDLAPLRAHFERDLN